MRASSLAQVLACRERQERLRAQFTAAGIDALLVSNPKEIRYLTGFFSGDCLLVVFDAGATLISDVRDEQAMQPTGASGVTDIAIGTQHRLPVTVAERCRRRGVRRLGVQGEHLTLAGRGRMAAELGGVTIVETAGLLASLRICKDQIELAHIIRAIAIHQDALRTALADVRVGMKEIEFCARLEYEMRQRGAEGTSFGTMIASSPRSSIIHYATSGLPIRPGGLLVDFGALVSGYCSDMTRTFGVGRMQPQLRRVYQVVLEAQQAAIAALAPGKTGAEVDAVARSIIERAGYGEQFGHGLGHGIGLDIHEPPYLNRLATDVVLRPGMVVTIEPGIYLPGVGGVRIEDDVLVTDGGRQVLTDYPKDLDGAILGSGGRSAKAATVARRRPSRSSSARAAVTGRAASSRRASSAKSRAGRSAASRGGRA